MTNMTSSRDNFDVCKIIANTVKYGGITMIFIIATINVIIGAKVRSNMLIKSQMKLYQVNTGYDK